VARVRIRARARAEIAEAFEWYHHRSEVAAADFLAELDVAINQISEAPEQFPVVQGLLRRVLIRRFPYAVYYKCYPNGVSVVGVIHGHRHPATWLRRAGP
jgi:plasmid stabilization system protein ParE